MRGGMSGAEKMLIPSWILLQIERLKANLANVAKGEAFLLQGGDCAGESSARERCWRRTELISLYRTELFDYCSSEKIEHRLSLLLSMSLILICESFSTSFARLR